MIAKPDLGHRCLTCLAVIYGKKKHCTVLCLRDRPKPPPAKRIRKTTAVYVCRAQLNRIEDALVQILSILRNRP